MLAQRGFRASHRSQRGGGGIRFDLSRLDAAYQGRFRNKSSAAAWTGGKVNIQTGYAAIGYRSRRLQEYHPPPMRRCQTTGRRLGYV